MFDQVTQPREIVDQKSAVAFLQDTGLGQRADLARDRLAVRADATGDFGVPRRRFDDGRIGQDVAVDVFEWRLLKAHQDSRGRRGSEKGTSYRCWPTAR